MRVSVRLAVLLATATATAAVVVGGLTAASAESNGGVRLMPLGDSITDGFNVPGGYRTELWSRLVAGGYSVDFVGSQYNGPSELGDHDHEGHSGWEISQIDANVVGWLQTYQPRTIMLQIGTNDILHNIDWANAPARLSTLLDHITATLPQVELFVASLPPLGGDYASYEAGVVAFNASVPGVVSTKAAQGYHVHFVDMHAALGTADLADGIHPSATGYAKMGAAWYSALLSAPSSLVGTGPTASASASPTATASPSAGVRSCTAAYRLVGQWSGGYQAEVSVTAGAVAISGWTVTWTLATGQSVTQYWNAVITVSGTAVSATNVSYNGALGAGAATTFGLLGGYTSTNPAPAPACTAR